MSPTIGRTTDGPTTPTPSRSGRRARVDLEALEPRLLLSGCGDLPPTGRILATSAQVASYQGAASPADDADDPDDASNAGVDLSTIVGPVSPAERAAWAATPGRSSSGNSSAKTSGGECPPPDSSMVTSGSSVAAGGSGVASSSATTGSAVTYNTADYAFTDLVTTMGLGTTSGSATATGSAVTTGGFVGPVAPAGFHAGTSPSSSATAAAPPASTNAGASVPTSTPGPAIAAGPLPSAPFEPAGGLFLAVGPSATAGRGDETRVDLALVSLLSPGPAGGRDDGPPSDPAPDATARRPARDPSRPEVVAALRPAGPVADAPARIAPNDLARDVSPAPEFLPPIVVADRPDPGESRIVRTVADEGGRRKPSRVEPGRATLLGLGGSVILGLGLYIPDLASTLHRALPRPRRRRRGHRPDPWPAPTPPGD